MRAHIKKKPLRIYYGMNLYRTAAVVTIFSALEHFLGFLYRIILSRTLGPEGLGVYQIAISVFAVFLTVCSSGLPVTLSRVISKHRARGAKQREHAATTSAVLITLLFSVPVTVLLFAARAPFSAIFSDPRCADLFYILLFGLSLTSVYSVIRGCFWGNKQFFSYSLIELAEEMIRILVGVMLLVCIQTGPSGENRAAVAVLVSYVCSFAIALVCFLMRGGKFCAPRGEFMPLLRASLPVTAMRASSSLIGSFISVLFPMRLRAAGHTTAQAMSEYGVVYGMVMPVMAVPSALIGSLALVLVPELSEHYYRKNRRQVAALAEKALNATLLIAGALIPFYAVCGADLGVLLYSNAQSGVLIARCAAALIPMSLTMICTSILNSLNCEKYTLGFFLLGSAVMLGCTWILPRFLGGGALLAGMIGDSCVTAACSLALLRKKTGRLRSVRYFLKLLAALAPAAALGFAARALLMRCMSHIPALILTVLLLAAAEAGMLALFRLCDFKAVLRRFFAKKSKKIAARA